MASKKKWDDLDITNDEAKRLCDAFKNDDFRKLFMEYAEEIQDPENRKRYEEELAQLEAERGMDVKFIHPEPGYVMKTSVDGSTKAFINICKNEHVGKPEMKKALHPVTGKMASSWSLPHSLSPPRDDSDKANQKCRVFDVVFHPDAYRMGETNAAFRKMINDSAIDTIERQFGVKIDKTNIKFPKLKFMGTPQATVIRSKKDTPKNSDGGKPDKNDSAEGNALIDDLLKKMPYPYDNRTSEEKSKENEVKKRAVEQSNKEDGHHEVTVPNHTIIHRHNVDFQDFRHAPDAGPSTRPRELVIHIDLPLLKSASSANLDIFKKRVLLESTTPAKYKLDLDLPYPVDDNSGSAKFDKSKRRLTVTLPVLEPEIPATLSQTNGFSEDSSHTPVQEGCYDDVPDLEEDVPELKDDVPELEDDVLEQENDLPDANSTHYPLIEVISSTNSTSPVESIQPLTNGHIHSDELRPDAKDIWTENDFDPKLLKPKIIYKLPAYIVNQDAETATFILLVKNVQRDSVSKTFGDNSVQLKFVSVGSGGYPMHYSYMVHFNDEYQIEMTACDVSMSDENVVMILGKTSESAGIWDKFLVGTDAEHLEEALFVTEKTLSSALDQLDANTMPLNNNDKMPDLEVTDMSDDHLTIQLSNTLPLDNPAHTNKYSESSDDIAIVHSVDQPNLHSILKDRTVSESSDEAFGVRSTYRREDSVSSILSTGSASEGPVSENDDPNTVHRKKSVSFSEYVDSTTYKANASVSTLHATLKKKSKRYRKKEAKIERRRRQSSGSEHEHSSEEQTSQPETSEGLDTGEEDDEDVVIDYQAGGELPEGPMADPHDDDEEGTHDVVAAKQPTKKNKKNKKKTKKSKSANEGFSEVNAASHTPPETKGDSMTSEEGESGVECVSVTNPEDGERTNGAANREGLNGDQQKLGQVGDCDSDDTENGTLSAAMAKCTQPGPERTNGGDVTAPVEQAVEDVPDTVLSWNDGPSTADQSDVTKCAFNFSNTMMYDLDDD